MNFTLNKIETEAIKDNIVKVKALGMGTFTS